MKRASPGKAAIEKLIDEIISNGATLRTKKATTGFDGFVDTLVRIIREKKEKKPSILFRTKKEFAKYILEKGESSFSLELEELSARIGGNMPIMSNALGYLGVQVNCIGSLGFPQLHPVFKNLSAACQTYSFADPGFSTAYEFNDGKILLAQMGALNKLAWTDVKNTLGKEALISLYRESDLLCLVNWSEIGMSTDIWKGVLNEVLPNLTTLNRRQIAFFDLADCSKRSKQAIREALIILHEYSKYAKVILGLNANEANVVYEILYEKKPKKDLQIIGERIFDKIGIELLLIHSSRQALAFQKKDVHSLDSFYISTPTILTGAGDNFNAGFCAGQLLELDLDSCLTLAHAVSGSYVKTGRSPQLTEVTRFLKNI